MSQKFRSAQNTQQHLALSQSMQQSLRMLRMTVPELLDHLKEEALSNPLLEINEQDMAECMNPFGTTDLIGSFSQREEDYDEQLRVRYRDEQLSDLHAWTHEREDSWDTAGSLQSSDSGDFSEMLIRQLGTMRDLSAEQRSLCEYLTDCLNERGYLDVALEEIALDLDVPVPVLEEALSTLQSLFPAGVGARSLPECLRIQILRSFADPSVSASAQSLSAPGSAAAQGAPAFPDLDDTARRALQILDDAGTGMEIAAAGNLQKLARHLGCTKKEASAAFALIRSLNPIPANGYGSRAQTHYLIPEASVINDNGRLLLEMNRRSLPRVGIDHSIEQLLAENPSDVNTAYLNTNLSNAKNLIRGLEDRRSTMERLLSVILRRQEGYFLYNTPLVPMTMGDVAAELGVHISTVSRAVHEKTIIVCGRAVSLRSLFSAELRTGSARSRASRQSVPNDSAFGAAAGIETEARPDPSSADQTAGSIDAVKQQILRLIDGEDKTHPLSDDDIRLTLESLQMPVSRRTVAYYRKLLGIPSSSGRRRR